MAEIINLNSEHYNILKVSCILTSTGFNKNDHYFIPAILYKKRNTPLFQMVDWEHDTSYPIGCIAASRCIDKNGEVINEADLAMENELDFNLEVDLAIWKSYYPRDAEEVVDKKKKENLCVSMEALVRDFYFAMHDQIQNKIRFLELNDNTSFLLAHLKNFGGTGYYKKYRIGMAFSDYDFSGVGLTTNPANPKSIIKEISDENKKVAKKIEKNNKKDEKNEKKCVDKNREEVFCLANNQKNDILGDKKNMEAKEYEDKIAKLEKEIAEKNNELADVKTKLTEKEKSLVEKSQAMEEVTKANKTELEKAQKKTEDVKISMEEKIASLQEENKNLKEKVDEYIAKARLQERKNRLNEIGASIDEDKLEKWSDEVFEDVLGLLPKKEASKEIASKEEKEDEEVELEVASKEENIYEERMAEPFSASKDKQIDSNLDLDLLAKGIKRYV